ncbi:MAG: DUF1398 domain-containing protein [Proteobacteria bacterium]|nr:DUF1398 domain-containing protein [Pseudomonadota bacterium]
MDAPLTDLARRTLDGAYSGAMSFPEIVGALMGAGFEGYMVDYRTKTATYFHPEAAALILPLPASADAIALAFDGVAIAAQVAWAQRGEADYSYAAFCRNVKSAGCAGYMVSFPGRRVVYFGCTAETHTEHFPG